MKTAFPVCKLVDIILIHFKFKQQDNTSKCLYNIDQDVSMVHTDVNLDGRVFSHGLNLHTHVSGILLQKELSLGIIFLAKD